MNVVDELSLSVNPPGDLGHDVTIVIRCMVRYAGRAASETVSEDQEPKLTIMLGNEVLATEPENTRYEPPTGANNLHIKTLVILFISILSLMVL